MKTEEAVNHFGGQKQLASALGIWPHNIKRWGEKPPMLRQYELEKLTEGKLKAENPNG